MKTCRACPCSVKRDLSWRSLGLLLFAAALPAQSQYLSITGSGTLGSSGTGVSCVHSIRADFNNNGFDDILYFDLVMPSYSVLLDPGVNGLGLPPTASLVFPGGPPNNAAYGSGARRGFAAELTGDGNVDVVLLFPLAGVVALYPGLGNGSLSTSTAVVLPVALPPSPWNATLLPTDLDNDGLLDIVIMRPTTAAPSSPSALVSLRNQHPTWQYLTANTLPVSAELTGTGDFDADGNADLMLTASDSVLNTGCLPLWGVGNGTFTGPPAWATSTLPYVPTGSGCSQLAVKWIGDVNADGRDDALINYYCASSGGGALPVWQELLYYGNSNRTFLSGFTFNIPSTYPPSPGWGGEVSACGLFDMDLDGYQDIFIEHAFIQWNSNPAIPGVAQVRALTARGLGGGNFDPVLFATVTPPFNVNPAVCPGLEAHVSDFDRDGDLDVFRGAGIGFQIHFCNRAILGVGCSGTFAAPLLNHGIASVGNSLHAVSVSGAVPNSAAVIAVSAGMHTIPLGSCGVYVDTLSSTAWLPGMTNALGILNRSLPIPNNPLLHGIPFHAQAAVLDPFGPYFGGLNIALTSAHTVIVW